jgi:hypothetical protein
MPSLKFVATKMCFGLRHLWAEAETETHIDQVLHRYQFDSAKTTLQKPNA